MLEQIIQPFKSFWKSITDGADKEDVYKIILGDTDTLNKVVKNENYRKNLLKYINTLQQQNPNKPIKQAFIDVLTEQFKKNKSLKTKFDKEIITKPNIKHFSYLQVLEDLGKETLTPQELAFIQKNNISPDLYSVAKGLLKLGVITEKDLKNKVFYTKNLELTFKGYLKHKNITQAFEKIGQVLDAISLGTALFSGGTALIGKVFIKKAGEEVLKRHILKAMINKGLLVSDLSFLGARSIDLFTDVKLKNQNPSISDVVFSGVALLPFVSPVKKQIRKLAKPIDTPPSGETLKKLSDIGNLEWVKSLTEIPRKEVRGTLIKAIEARIPVYGGGQVVEKIQPVFVPMVEGFTKAYGERLGIKFAEAYINPHHVINFYNLKKENLRSFIQHHLKSIEQIYKNLHSPEAIRKVLNESPDLVEFFALNSAKYNLDKIRFFKRNLDKFLQKTGQSVVRSSDLILDLGEDFRSFVETKGLSISHLTLDDLINKPEAIQVFEEFIKRQIKEGRVAQPIEWFIKQGDDLVELKEVIHYHKIPDTLWNIYIPTSDFPQAFKILIKTEDTIQEKTLYLPNELVVHLQEKVKDTKEFLVKLEEYIRKYHAIPEDAVIEIVDRYKPELAFMPTKRAFREIFDDALKYYEKSEKFLKKLDTYLDEVKKQGILVKEAEALKQEIRDFLKSIAEKTGIETYKVRTDILLKKLENLGHLRPDVAEEISKLLREIKETKSAEILIKSDLAKKIANILKKTEDLLDIPPEEIFYRKFVDLYYTPPWEFRRGTLHGFLRFTDFLDDEAKIDYLTRSYLRTYANEERMLLTHIHFFDKVIQDTFGDTAFGKAWNLVRTYHFGGEGFQAKMINFLNKMSRLFTLLNPTVPLGAYIQVKAGLSSIFPSYQLVRSSLDFASEIVRNKAFVKEFIQKYIKAQTPGSYLPSFYRFFESVLQMDMKNALLKNEKFRNEVKTFFNLTHFDLSDVDSMVSLLTSLIDNPASLSLLTGGSKIGNVLAAVQSWYPLIVAPFQIASLNLLKALKGPDRMKYFMNTLYLTALGSIFLPSTISPLVMPVETVRKLYEDIVAPSLAMVNLLFRNEPPPFETWLEKKDPIVERLVKNLFENFTDIPKENFSGRFFADLGKALALHGDEHHFSYIHIGLQKLSDILKRFDLAEKGLVSAGALSTSFDFTFPVWQSAFDLIRAFAFRKAEGKQVVDELLTVYGKLNPVLRNLRYGLVKTLTGYGPQKDVTQDKILADTLKDIVEDDKYGFVIGLAYNLGVLMSHPTAFLKMLDMTFTHSFVENLKTFGEELITGKPAKVEYVYLPKVRNIKDIEEKIVGKEDLIISSITKTENKEAVLNAIQNYVNILAKRFETDKALDIERDRSLLKSFNLLVSGAINVFPELENLIVADYNKLLEGSAKKYGKQTVMQWLKEDLEEMRLRAKLTRRVKNEPTSLH